MDTTYWQLKKSWLWGDLSGGAVLWKISLTNTNPNPGIGDYDIASGTITDFVDCGVISGLYGATGVGTSAASGEYPMNHMVQGFPL